MAAARWQIALLIRDASAEHTTLLLTPLPPPLSSSDPSRDSQFPFEDSELWDLPSAPLSLISQNTVDAVDTNSDSENWSDGSKEVAISLARDLEAAGLPRFHCMEAIHKIQSVVDPIMILTVAWKFYKVLEEPEFGPGDQLHTIVFLVEKDEKEASQVGNAQWFTHLQADELLKQTEAGEKRIGLLAAFGFSLFTNDLLSRNSFGAPGQEYPPGITVLPMKSRTLKPFSKTNLVVVASERPAQENEQVDESSMYADSLIVDPGSSSVVAKAHLARIVKLLPKKLLVFLTHHHVDHIEGLSIVQQHNPQAIVVAHATTLKRANKAVKAFHCIAVTGGSKLHVAGQELKVIAAPGHTDSHLALFHLGARTLIAGDHCVGEGSSFLDSNSGGNMQEYLDTTRQLLNLRPHYIVPMHGRPNFWPINLLKGYMRHRETRETKILKTIENGARTAYQVVSESYKGIPITAWPAALHNVKLHVQHLNQTNRLPPDFSMKAFEKSTGAAFFIQYIPAAVSEALHSNSSKTYLAGLSGTFVVAVAIFSLSVYWARAKALKPSS